MGFPFGEKRNWKLRWGSSQSSLYDFWVWVLVASLILCLYKMLGSLSLLASKGDVCPHISASVWYSRPSRIWYHLNKPTSDSHHPHLSQSQTPHPSGLLIISSHRSVYFNELSQLMFQYKAQFINAFIISCNWEFQSWNKLRGGFIQRSLPLFFSDSLDHALLYLPPSLSKWQSWVKELEHGWVFFSPPNLSLFSQTFLCWVYIHETKKEMGHTFACIRGHIHLFNFIQRSTVFAPQQNACPLC